MPHPLPHAVWRPPHAAALLATAALLCLGSAQAESIKPYWEFKKPRVIELLGDLSFDTNNLAPPVMNGGSAYRFGFEGISQYDGAGLGRNLIPPDTIGASGPRQYMETTNGAYAVFDKATGDRLMLKSDVQWWNGLGQTGTQGDARVMFNGQYNRWIAIAFGANPADIQIAVSATDDALGLWRSTRFTGFAGGVADYPTLAMDTKAAYIGTNNFKVGCSASNPSAQAFCGTTLNVIPLNSLFNIEAGPTTNGMAQFNAPLGDGDAGFTLQGVNTRTAAYDGRVVAASRAVLDNVTFKVSGVETGTAEHAVLGPTTYLGMQPFAQPVAGRQPGALLVPENRRIIDTIDERISASAYEHDGKVYTVSTVTSARDPSHAARVRVTVFDADSSAILFENELGYGNYDFYQGSIAVNDAGQVVIAYNRSGEERADLNGDGLSDGNISFMAQTFMAAPDGRLISSGAEMTLKVSLTSDYHNGSFYLQPYQGRQRWGDYSAVSIDPEDGSFWAIGEFAREYNLPQFGHPDGTGGSRWGTWVAHIVAPTVAIPVPEPASALLLAGGLLALLRRRARHPAAR